MLPTKVHVVKVMVFTVVMNGCHLDQKESWALKNSCFWTVVLKKILESLLDCKEIKPVNPQRDQPWICIESTGAEAAALILWPPAEKKLTLWKWPWCWEGLGAEDEMAGWHHQLPEFTQTHVHQLGDAIQPSHPLSSPSPALNPSKHQSLFQWVNSSHEVAKILEFQPQHQSFQRTPRTDLL